jgi:hypothetical protein
MAHMYVLLFNDVFSPYDYVASNGRMIESNELERI